MKRLSIFNSLILSLFIVSCGNSKPKEETTVVADTTSAWISLFNGEDFDGWEMYGEEPIMGEWAVIDGAIVCNQGLGENNSGFNRSIMTTQDFENFEFELEYKIAKGGNSGIFYHVVESPEFGHDYMTGPEYQVLDDEFSRSESEAYKMAASNYSMHAALETKKPNPFMEWNKVKIVYNNGHVEHWLNDEKVVEFEEGDEAYKGILAESKWANTPSYAASETGRFSLQNHGDEVYYKNIRVRPLN
ncbi:MAG: hypothetical protein ACJAXB_002825 [Candidatus Endobugula sp.]|jgi:hypothetical protein